METKKSLLKIGNHVSKGKCMSASLLEDKEKFNNVIKNNEFYPIEFSPQIFTIGPQSSKDINLDKDEIRILTHSNQIELYVHSSYISRPWGTTKGGLYLTQKELKIAAELGAKGLVIHLPKNTLEYITKALPNIVNDINFTKDKNVMLILEAPAMKHDDEKTYETPERINELCKAIIDMKLQNDIGICLDTSHLHSTGIPMSLHMYVDSFFKKLKYPEMIKLIHFNDNEWGQGTGRDEHNSLMAGQIWKNFYSKYLEIQKNEKYTLTEKKEHSYLAIKYSGMRSVIEFCLKYDVPIILERHREASLCDVKVIGYLVYGILNNL